MGHFRKVKFPTLLIFSSYVWHSMSCTLCTPQTGGVCPFFMKHISAIPDILNTKAPCFQGAYARSKGKGYSAVRVARNRLSRLFRIAHSQSAILLPLQRPAHNAGMFVFPHVNLCGQQQFGFFQLSFNLFIFLYRYFRFKNLLVQPHPGFTCHIASLITMCQLC